MARLYSGASGWHDLPLGNTPSRGDGLARAADLLAEASATSSLPLTCRRSHCASFLSGNDVDWRTMESSVSSSTARQQARKTVSSSFIGGPGGQQQMYGGPNGAGGGGMVPAGGGGQYGGG